MTETLEPMSGETAGVSPALAKPSPLRQRGSNHVGMRAFNERVVLQAIRLHGSVPKAELARLTGLTPQTIGLITSRLEEDGLLIRHAPVRGRIGQPSVPMALAADGAFAVGIKVGRRSTDWLLVDFTGHVRERISVTYAFPDAATLISLIGVNLGLLARSLGTLQPRLVGVGVAAPLQFGGWHRLLGLPKTQSDDWNRIDLRAQIQHMTELPVSFAKDTSAACVAELVAGRGRDLKSFLYLFVDTFVGGGLVLDSKPQRGARGNAGAVASLPLEMAGLNSPPQLVTQASLWELEQAFKAVGLDAAAAYDDRAMQEPFAALTELWVSKASNALAHSIVSATALLDVEAVVMDGSCCPSLVEKLIAATTNSLANYNWEGLWPVRLVAGSIGSDARALGGALLPLHANFAPDQDQFLTAGQ
jgi:predicted NBD/HSP70 family sugar kinase